jgi:hypothetical protein
MGLLNNNTGKASFTKAWAFTKAWPKFLGFITFGLLGAGTVTEAIQQSAEYLFAPSAALLTAAAIEIVRGFKTVADERQSAQESPLTLEERWRLLRLVTELRRQLDLLTQRGVISEDFRKKQHKALENFQKFAEKAYEARYLPPADWENMRTYMEYLAMIDSLIKVRVRLLDIVSLLRYHLKEGNSQGFERLKEAEEFAKEYEGTAEQDGEFSDISSALEEMVSRWWWDDVLNGEQTEELRTRLRELAKANDEFQSLRDEFRSLLYSEQKSITRRRLIG